MVVLDGTRVIRSFGEAPVADRSAITHGPTGCDDPMSVMGDGDTLTLASPRFHVVASPTQRLQKAAAQKTR